MLVGREYGVVREVDSKIYSKKGERYFYPTALVSMNEAPINCMLVKIEIERKLLNNS